MFTEDDLLPLSGLQHLLFCERQWALIHIEQQWAENRLTAEGRLLHERVHEPGTEARPGRIVARSLRIQSMRLGLAGETDVVEFHQAPTPVPGVLPPSLVQLQGRPGWWAPFPVEYKRGRPKPDSSDEVQLCAQALCLEETLAVSIPAGALFYGKNRRRTMVAFDPPLRALTERLAARMHQLYAARITPPAVYSKKCENCSLIERCMPRITDARHNVARYLSNALASVRQGGPRTAPGDRL